MYWEKGDTLQGEPSGKNIRYKKNIVFIIFLCIFAGVLSSFYINVLAGGAIGACGFLMSLILKNKKLAIVFLFFFIAFIRASSYIPTEGNIKEANYFGVSIDDKKEAKYEFVFKDKVDAIIAIPEKVFGERGNLVSAVMFGDKKGVEQSTLNTFSESGISHVIAVSGLHVGILVSSLAFTMKKVKRRWVKPVVIIPFLLALMVLSAFSPSVLRASLMMGIYLFADMIGERYNLLNSLLISGAIILVITPYNIFDVGFLLSFSSTLGIALFYSPLFNRLKVFGKFLGGACAMYIACQVTSLPLIIFVFKEISVLGLLGNIFAVPIVSFALVCGLVGVAVYPLGIAYYPLSFSAAFMEIIEFISGEIAAVPFAVVALGTVGIWLILGYYILLTFPCNFAMNRREPLYWCIGAYLAVITAVGFITI